MTTTDLVAAVMHRWPDSGYPPPPGADPVIRRLRGIYSLFLTRAGDDVEARVFGWDRELTEFLDEPSRVFADQAPSLLASVDRLLDSLERAPDVDLPPTDVPRSDGAGWDARVTATLAARAGRERGEAPRPLDPDDLVDLLREEWPDAEVERVTRAWGRPVLVLRPRRAGRVAFGWDRHGTLWATFLFGFESIAEMDDGELTADDAAESARRLIGRVDDRVLASLPPSWVLDLPIVEAPWPT